MQKRTVLHCLLFDVKNRERDTMEFLHTLKQDLRYMNNKNLILKLVYI